MTGEDAPCLFGGGLQRHHRQPHAEQRIIDGELRSRSPEAVDFARLMGLRTLVAFNTIPQGTYNSVTFTFENKAPAPIISYVDVTTESSVGEDADGILLTDHGHCAVPDGSSAGRRQQWLGRSAHRLRCGRFAGNERWSDYRRDQSCDQPGRGFGFGRDGRDHRLHG